MISQAEILAFATLKSQADKLEAQIKATRESLIERVVAKEETEAGEYALKHSEYPKTSTKYKPVLEGLTPELTPEQTEILAGLLAQNSTTKQEHRLEAVIATEEVVVVKKTKKLKVA